MTNPAARPALPKYPASIGPNSAARLRKKQTDYRSKIEDLRRELTKAEATFAEAFNRADAATSARQRIADLATPQRRI